MFEAIRRDYDKHCGQADGSAEVSGKVVEERLDLTSLLQNDLLWAEAADGGDITEKVLVVMRILITAADHGVPVSKEGYENLLRSLTIEVRAVCREMPATIRELDVKNAKKTGLELEVPKTSSAEEAELASTKFVLDEKKAFLMAKVRKCDQLNSDLISAQLLSVEERGSSVTLLSGGVPGCTS